MREVASRLGGKAVKFGAQPASLGLLLLMTTEQCALQSRPRSWTVASPQPYLADPQNHGYDSPRRFHQSIQPARKPRQVHNRPTRLGAILVRHLLTCSDFPAGPLPRQPFFICGMWYIPLAQPNPCFATHTAALVSIVCVGVCVGEKPGWDWRKEALPGLYFKVVRLVVTCKSGANHLPGPFYPQ